MLYCTRMCCSKIKGETCFPADGLQQSLFIIYGHLHLLQKQVDGVGVALQLWLNFFCANPAASIGVVGLLPNEKNHGTLFFC